MIQRIQSVYLFLIAGIMLAMLFFPTIKGITSVSEEFVVPAIYNVLTGLCLSVLIVWTAIMALIALFIYKKRLLQIKICIGIIALIALIYCLCLFVYIGAVSKNANFVPGIAIAFPLLALILDIMAINRIKKDEKLVRSLDRIR